MNAKVYAKVKKDHPSIINMDLYTGFITVMQGKKYLYSKFSGITRLTHADALADAEMMRQEIMQGTI